MCGIAGIVSPFQSDINIPMLKRMSDVLSHRGPDGEGVWISLNKSVGLAHRRLAIIDLSFRASQPMQWNDRYTITYNGEIYNYIEVRKTLQKAGYQFKTDSDTEVILAAYDFYKEDCVNYFDGMFAFAIWDEIEQILFAARDRFGEKPFYYFKDRSRFIFGSEMKAIWATGVNKSVDPKMLLNYLTLGQVQNPSNKAQTFFNEIFSLPPAHYLTLHKNKLNIEAYWHLEKQKTISIKEEEAIQKLDELLSVSIARRMRSDVKIGTSLSGGIDSTSLLHYILQNTTSYIKTFTAVFPEFEKDEYQYVKKVVSDFRIENFTVAPNEWELIENFKKLLYHQEEPFGSSSIYAQYRVYQLAKEHDVTVLLDGQGADEIFAGYHKYLHWFLQECVNKHQYGRLLKERKLFKSNHADFSFGLKNVAATYLPAHAAIQLEKREHKRIINHPDITPDFLSILSGKEWEGIHKPIVTKLNDSLHFDVMEYGLEELLRFADRNSMAHGCEVRLPFLNKELVEFAFMLPATFKMQGGYTKSILRKLMNQRLPDDITWRKDKIGFEPPQKKWMMSPIMNEYLYESKKTLVQLDILKPNTLNKKSISLNAHDPHNYDWRYLCAAEMLIK